MTFDKQVLKRSVALVGDVFDPSGTLTGGSRSQTTSILACLQELCEAEATLQQQTAALKEVEEELESIQAEATKYMVTMLISVLGLVFMGTFPVNGTVKLMGTFLLVKPVYSNHPLAQIGR